MKPVKYDRGLALARGFIVFVMPAIHTAFLYSNTATKKGKLGKLLGFLAESAGAPLFMLLMGLFVAKKPPQSFFKILKRSGRLLLSGYLLNVPKLVIPYSLRWIPEAFLKDGNMKRDKYTALRLFLSNDILQFAGIAYLYCAIIWLSKYKFFWGIITFLVALITGPFIWSRQPSRRLSNFIFQFIGGSPPSTFFPVFPWLVYPLAGMMINGFITTASLERKRMRILLCCAVTFIVSGRLTMSLEPESWHSNFYLMGPGKTMLHIGIVLFWLILFLWLDKLLPDNAFFKLLQWLSNNITAAYMAQWIILFWLFPVFGYNRLDTKRSIFIILFTSSLSFSAVYLFQKAVTMIKSHKYAGRNI